MTPVLRTIENRSNARHQSRTAEFTEFAEFAEKNLYKRFTLRSLRRSAVSALPSAYGTLFSPSVSSM